MDKELEDLLDNYERVIYGQAFPINPSIHQLHLLLDYIANLESQVKKQKEVIDRTIEYVEKHIKYECDNAYNGMQFYSYHLYDFNKRDLMNILKEVQNENN